MVFNQKLMFCPKNRFIFTREHGESIAPLNKKNEPLLVKKHEFSLLTYRKGANHVDNFPGIGVGIVCQCSQNRLTL